MYSSLPFALAQCMVEIPYNFVQVRAALGWILGFKARAVHLVCGVGRVISAVQALHGAGPAAAPELASEEVMCPCKAGMLVC